MAQYFRTLSLSSLDDALCAVAEITAAAPLAEWTVCCRSRYASHDYKAYEITARWHGAELTRSYAAWTARLSQPCYRRGLVNEWLQCTPSLTAFCDDQGQIFSMLAPTQEALSTLVNILRYSSYKDLEQHAEQQQS